MKRDKRGFTLAELLVVVAIIAVLVAIAIPIFTSQLEKSREATDAANIRSQYAQVMTDAITNGGDVNGQTEYGAIDLKQKKDDWQDETLGNNLHGLFQKVDGDYPKANGTAWVEYKASESKVILHYEGEGSGNGGSSSGDSTGGNGGSSGGITGNTGSVNFDSLAIDWDSDIKTLNTYTVEVGKIYSWNGNFYFGSKTYDLNSYDLNYNNPDTFTGWYALSKYTGTCLTMDYFNSGNQNQQKNVNRGDVCSVGNDYYAYIGGGGANYGPEREPDFWVKLTF